MLSWFLVLVRLKSLAIVWLWQKIGLAGWSIGVPGLFQERNSGLVEGTDWRAIHGPEDQIWRTVDRVRLVHSFVQLSFLFSKSRNWRLNLYGCSVVWMRCRRLTRTRTRRLRGTAAGRTRCPVTTPASRCSVPRTTIWKIRRINQVSSPIFHISHV